MPATRARERHEWDFTQRITDRFAPCLIAAKGDPLAPRAGHKHDHDLFYFPDGAARGAGVMRALVTAFEPFGGESVNSSLEAVRRLPARAGGLEIATDELPTSFARSLPALARAIQDASPAIVLCVGQARTRGALSMERVAINVQDARLPDNDGAQPSDLPVVAGGPAAYFSTLPVRSAVAALHAAGLPAEISNTAGTFVCNHVFYGLMHFAALQQHAFGGGVLHVPRLAMQAADEPGAPCMELDDIVRGIVIVLETAAALHRAG